MRILMLLYNLRGEGTYWRALPLAKYLAKRGHDITFMCTPNQRQSKFITKHDEKTGITAITSPNYLGGMFSYGWDPGTVGARLLWSMRQRDFDLIHSFESRPTVIIPALYWQRCRGARLVLDWCDWFGQGGAVEERPSWLIRTLLRPAETFFEERFRAKADGTTVINNKLRQRAIKLEVPPEAILLLPNGSNVDEIQPKSKREARRELGWRQDVPIIGYIGSIFQHDAELMAQAFDKVRKAEPESQLLLIGYCNVDVRELVHAPEAVKCTGQIDYDQIRCYLSACDVCWLPMQDSNANRGRSPLKIKDYMAAGRPVVMTAVGDAADLIRRGKFGLLAPTQPEEIANQVLALLRTPERREIMGQRARQLAETEFSWNRITDRLEYFYQQVVEGTQNEVEVSG